MEDVFLPLNDTLYRLLTLFNLGKLRVSRLVTFAAEGREAGIVENAQTGHGTVQENALTGHETVEGHKEQIHGDDYHRERGPCSFRHKVCVHGDDNQIIRMAEI